MFWCFITLCSPSTEFYVSQAYQGKFLQSSSLVLLQVLFFYVKKVKYKFDHHGQDSGQVLIAKTPKEQLSQCSIIQGQDVPNFMTPWWLNSNALLLNFEMTVQSTATTQYKVETLGVLLFNHFCKFSLSSFSRRPACQPDYQRTKQVLIKKIIIVVIIAARIC